MIAILLVSHGTYAKAMLETAGMILGPQEHAAAVGLSADESPDQLREELTRAMEGFQGMELLVLTDITSGTPFNTVMSLTGRYSFRHLTGINLPLLIETLICRQFVPLEDLAKSLLEKAPATFVDVDGLLAQNAADSKNDPWQEDGF